MGGLRRCYASRGSEPRPASAVGFGVTACRSALDLASPHEGGSEANTLPMSLRRLWAMGIKNTPSYAARPTRYRGMHVLPRCLMIGLTSWACKTCGRQHIKCLQDMWTGGCRAATVQRQPVVHSRSIAIVLSYPTTQRHAAHGCDVVE
jgi:hypothetical protein